MTVLAQVRAIMDGERVPLDEGATKLLYFMLHELIACDASIGTQLTAQFAPGDRYHPYHLELAPAIVSWLLDHAPTGHLPAGTLPYWGGLPKRWAYGPCAVWIVTEPERVMIRIRNPSPLDDPRRAPPPLPPPVDEPPRFKAGDHACPHCGAVPERYRVLGHGTLVCLACGRSSPA